MKRKTSLPELLCPAGSFDALISAVSAGADAVYIGGKSFGARAYAKNFDIEEIKKAVELCHIHGVKLYVTVNTLVYDRELSELSDFAAELYRIGVDAVISADLGAIAEIRRRAPGLAVHASTQMSVHNAMGADAALDLGCERVVLARELSEKDIREVTEKCKAETEVFLHGALCVCHSGQCLFSSLVGGRSGNRGECAQPCRLPYGKGYPLSLKDLSLAKHIKSLIDSGVASLKIEGRMKSPEYVYRVTKIYRELLDSYRNATEKEEEELKRVFSRGGFTDGYYKGRLGSGMLGVRSEEDKKESRGLRQSTPSPEKVAVKAVCKMTLDEPSELTFSLSEKSVTVYGAAPAAAENSPLTEDSVKERLMKLGGTELSLRKEDISLTLGERVNLAPSQINSLRRAAAEALMNAEREPSTVEGYRRKSSNKQTKVVKTAYFYSPETLLQVKETNPEVLSLLDKIFIPAFKLEQYGDSDVGVAIPPVIFESELSDVREIIKTARDKGVKDTLISNISHAKLMSDFGFSLTGDFRLNVTNIETRLEYEKMGIEGMILSPELTLPMARDIGGSVIVYGRILLMLTERCLIKDSFGCEQCSKAALTDRTGMKFPMLREYPHRNIILNSTPTYMGDKAEELKAAGLNSHHFIFTVESAREIIEIITAYKNKKPLSAPVRRMGKR